MTAVEWYLVAVVHLALVPALGYPVAWGARGTWRRNRVGRALMYKAASLGGLFAVAVAKFWWPSTWLTYIYAAMVTLVALSLYRQFWVLLSVQHEAGKGDTERGDL